jgi:Ran GTPase-activating protein (RanGAP) involved in mRNA processing and transport
MCERARRKLYWLHNPYDKHSKLGDATIQTADFGVFIDFMSMFQPDSGAPGAYKKPEQQASFRRALHNIGLLYGHAGTTVFKLTKTPLPPGGDKNRIYEKRGWTHLERRLGDLEAPASNSLDVAAWPTAEAERATMMKEEDKKKYEEEKHPSQKGTEYNLLGVTEPTAAQRGPPQLRESEEELAAQGDYARTGDPGTLGALIRDGGRGAPVSPEHFEEELKEKVFSFDSDRTVCAGLYRGVAEPLLADVKELSFSNLAWTAADWRHLGGALACCTKLRRLYLKSMGADDAGMAAFGGALGSGAAPALVLLSLTNNKIGDEEMRHLADALARGAAPALERLYLESNKIGDDGMRHLGDALARGAAPALEALYLIGNSIGVEGARHLADALARGAAPALEELWLNQNEIGDEGLRHLGDALARGAAPALGMLNLMRNPASDAAKGVVRSMVRYRCRPEQLLDGAYLVEHFADAKDLDCYKLGWGDEEARRFAAALEHATAQGALKALEKIDLRDNTIGDEGLRHLGDALVRGAAPALKELDLHKNPASDVAQQAVQDVLKNRK